MHNEATETTQNVKQTGKKSIILTVILAVLALTALAGALYLKFFADTCSGTGTGSSANLSANADMSTIVLSQTRILIPYSKTDIPSVVYVASPNGQIQFYEFDGKNYNAIDAGGSMEISITLSGQHIPATIYYIERDGILTGFGLFTPDSSDTEVYIYDFVLFKVTQLPKAYAQDGKCLLLVHTDKNQAYSDEIVWEEAYTLDRASGATERFLNENNRTVDITGAVRPDFCMLTDTELTAPTSVLPFFSSRNYGQDAGSNDIPIDIFIKNGKAKEVDAVTNVLDTYAKPLDDGGFVYIQKTDSGFNTVKYQNGQNTVVNMFYATYGSSYIRNGDWILSKEDGRIYSTYDDTVIEPAGYMMNPLLFAVSPDRKYVVMLGTVANAMDYRLYVYNTETKAYKTYNESNYAAHNNLRFSSDSTITFYTISSTSGFENVIVDISKV